MTRLVGVCDLEITIFGSTENRAVTFPLYSMTIEDASLHKAPAHVLSLLESCFIWTFSNLVSSWATTEWYLFNTATFTSYSLFIFFSTNCEFVWLTGSFTPSWHASCNHDIKASYFAVFLDVWNPKDNLYYHSFPLGSTRRTPTLDFTLAAELST